MGFSNILISIRAEAVVLHNLHASPRPLLRVSIHSEHLIESGAIVPVMHRLGSEHGRNATTLDAADHGADLPGGDLCGVASDTGNWFYARSSISRPDAKL